MLVESELGLLYTVVSRIKGLIVHSGAPDCTRGHNSLRTKIYLMDHHNPSVYHSVVAEQLDRGDNFLNQIKFLFLNILNCARCVKKNSNLRVQLIMKITFLRTWIKSAKKTTCEFFIITRNILSTTGYTVKQIGEVSSGRPSKLNDREKREILRTAPNRKGTTFMSLLKWDYKLIIWNLGDNHVINRSGSCTDY
uniref:Uncharacterized protein n=1 Tax=Heterorhabditis bacteriophora TaxID=37862 RepID=A0A1I7WAN5_HETBA